ncbi:hypothetical protein PVAP13_7NG115900 [Panicum virgatum]|uniref:Uncharacterized protein n=1 Tax=Panicum virgatum TaxID=38727 RepID=A0A8T0PU43_PANVG|nr:hypothetical protein PVAP13_7NG115900 [Panicum virgatum]
MLAGRYRCSFCVCCAGQAEQLSEDVVQAPAAAAPSIHEPLNLGASQGLASRSCIAEIQSHVVAQILRTILGVQISNSCPSNVKAIH